VATPAKYIERKKIAVILASLEMNSELQIADWMRISKEG
jgi:hypothetical protein